MSQKENETHFLSEHSYIQVLTNTDLYFSKGRANQELLKYFKNNTARLSAAKPSRKAEHCGYCELHSTLEGGRSSPGSPLAQVSGR